MKSIIYIILLFVFSSTIFPQKDTSETVDKNKLLIIAGATSAAFIYGYAIQNTIWWKGTKSNFHVNFNQDWTYAHGSDKFGHFFFGTLITSTYSKLFQWSGMSKRKSLFYGALVSFSYQTFIEIRDGFSKDYGFSPGDFTANLLGALYPNLQELYPRLKSFNFKISYFPSERFKHGSNRYLIDDYESTYNWLSIKLSSILPSGYSNYIPKFVALALGHSVKKLNTSGVHHEFYISLDWDFTHVKTSNPILGLLLNFINKYHLPAPAVKIYPDVIWYGIKF